MIATAYNDEQQLLRLLPPGASDEELLAATLADMALTVTEDVRAVSGRIPNDAIFRIEHVANYLVVLHRRFEDGFPKVGQREAQNLRQHARAHGWSRADVDAYLFRVYKTRRFTRLHWLEYLEFRRRTQFPPEGNLHDRSERHPDPGHGYEGLRERNADCDGRGSWKRREG